MGFAGFGDLGFDFDMDFDAFDFEGKEADPLETCVYTRPVVRRPQTCAWEHAQDLARDLVIDNEHETFAFVSGNFVFGDLLEALVDAKKLSVRRLGIQTLSMSDENIDSIRNVLEMMPVERLDLVLSDYWYAHESHKGGLVPYLFEELDLEGLELRVAFAGVHCKILTVETLRGNHITMHGSANLRSSGNVEQLHISPDDGLFEFCDRMTQRILDAYDVVNQDNRKRKKSVRRARLWQAVAKAGAEEPAGRAAEAAGAPATDEPSASRAERQSSGSSAPGPRAGGTTSTASSPSDVGGGPADG
jgi:hypothetical protein